MIKKHALIIEDNEDNIEVLKRLLANEGVVSTVIVNPNQLETTLHKLKPIDIVFLDLQLQRTTGYDVFKFLKDSARISAPVVAYTVHANQIGQVRAFGFNSFLGKPLDPQRFPHQLSRIFGGESVWDVT
jgi:two-component system, cell cycle response regulator DivK